MSKAPGLNVADFDPTRIRSELSSRFENSYVSVRPLETGVLLIRLVSDEFENVPLAVRSEIVLKHLEDSGYSGIASATLVETASGSEF